MEEEEVVTDNTENRFTVDLLFVKLLLPALRAFVTERIETFFEEHPVLKKPGGYREGQHVQKTKPKVTNTQLAVNF